MTLTTKALFPYDGQIYDVHLGVDYERNFRSVQKIENYDTLEQIEKGSEIWIALEKMAIGDHIEHIRQQQESIAASWARDRR